MKHVSNRDVFPTDQTSDLFSPIKCLLTNPGIDEAFMRHEAAAVQAKKLYHNVGRFAIILIAASAIYTVAEALIVPSSVNTSLFSLTAVLFASLGITLQIFLIVTQQKEKWLLNRYAVERLRSAKFQSFYLAQSAPDADTLNSQSDDFALREVATLENEMNSGFSILNQFRPASAVNVMKTSKRPVNADLNHAAKAAYIELRIQYQRRFAERELATYKDKRRVFYSSQDMMYLSAAGFTLLALAAKLFGGLNAILPSGTLDFAAVTLFIVGATVAILDNASIQEQSQTRFEQYVRDIEQLEATADRLHLSDIVHQMETLCLDELDTFCRAGERISYRL